MAWPLPTVQYLVAFQNNANDDPTAITTIASPPGTLGAHNVWTDITKFVIDDAHDRGRMHELQSFEAGVAQLILDNRDGQFTPWNTSSPYTGFLNPRVPVQIRATVSSTTYYRWTGQADSWAPIWDQPVHQNVILHASDAFRMFNQADITSTGYPTQILADGPSGYWRMGDTAGSLTAADSSGNNWTLQNANTGAGAETFGTTGLLVADPGTCVAMSTTSSTDIAQLNNNGAIVGASPNNITIEYWIKGSGGAAADSNVNGVKMLATLGGTTKVLFGLYGGNGTVEFTWDPGAHGTYHLLVNTNIIDGNTHHIVGTATSSAGSLTACTLYIDGANVASTGSPTTTAYTNVTMGVTVLNGNNATGSPTIDFQEVAVYASALSGATVLNHFNLAVIPQQSTDARVSRILDIQGWSSTARTLDSGVSTVQAVTSTLTNTSVLNHLQQVEATESGALFMTADGKVKFVSRQNLLSVAAYTASQATFGDNTGGGDIPFQLGPQIARDDIDLYTEAVATRQGGRTQRWPNPPTSTSITAYGRNTWNPPAALLGISDVEVLNLTQYAVAKYATPKDRLSSITIDLAAINMSFPSLIPTLLTLDLLYQVTVERTHMPGGATSFSQVSAIEKISETIHANPTVWTITYQMAVADPGWWILGTSQLGTTTRIAF